VSFTESISGSIWASLATDDYEDFQNQGQIQEIDLILGYSKEIFGVSTKLEYFEATYPGSGSESARHAQASLNAPTPLKLSVITSYSYGFDGWLDKIHYASAGVLGNGFSLGEYGIIKPMVSASYWSDSSESGLSHIHYQISHYIDNFALS